MQADVESKHGKVRHGSASSSLDEANCSSSSTAGVKRASSLSGCSGAQPSNSCCTSPPCSEEPSTSAGKTSKSQLWKASSSEEEEAKANESQGEMDTQNVEQRSTNSSEFDSPSLSGSLPSVADSHWSCFSSEHFSSSPLSSPREGSNNTFLYINEESVDGAVEALPRRLNQEASRNISAHPVSPVRKHCIQTDI